MTAVKLEQDSLYVYTEVYYITILPLNSYKSHEKKLNHSEDLNTDNLILFIWRWCRDL